MDQQEELPHITKVNFKTIAVIDDGTNMRMVITILGDCWVMCLMKTEERCRGPIFLFPTTCHYNDFKWYFESIQYDFCRMNAGVKDFKSLEYGATWAVVCGWVAQRQAEDPLPTSFNIRVNREIAQEIIQGKK
jgi:hypothetical protein